MCGVWGFCGKRIHPAQKQAVALANAWRGVDGCGMVYKDEDEDFCLWKTGDSIIEACYRNLPPDDIWKTPFLLGHNRRKSQSLKNGWSNKANAHPFKIGNIVLAHNGFISNHIELAKELGIKERDVDSEVAAYLLDRIGIEGLSQIQGMATLWWVDVRDPNAFYIWCWRQDLAISQRTNSFAFSSETEPLKMSGLSRETGDNETGKAYMVDRTIGALLRVDILTCKHAMIKQIKGKEYQTATYASYANADWEGMGGAYEFEVAKANKGRERFVTDTSAALQNLRQMSLTSCKYICSKCLAPIYEQDIKTRYKEGDKKCMHKHCGGEIFAFDEDERVRYVALIYDQSLPKDRVEFLDWIQLRDQMEEKTKGFRLSFTKEQLLDEWNEYKAQEEERRNAKAVVVVSDTEKIHNVFVTTKRMCPECNNLIDEHGIGLGCARCNNTGFIKFPMNHQIMMEQILRMYAGGKITHENENYLIVEDPIGSRHRVMPLESIDPTIKKQDMLKIDPPNTLEKDDEDVAETVVLGE